MSNWENNKEELKEWFTWDKTEPVSDNLWRIGIRAVFVAVFIYIMLRALGTLI